MEFAQIRAISLSVVLTLHGWPGRRHSFSMNGSGSSKISRKLAAIYRSKNFPGSGTLANAASKL